MLLALLGMVRGPTDEELVARFKAGDRSAYDELARRYEDRVFTLCLRWIGHRQVAEETAQDVLIALYRSLANFRGESKVSTWIYRVAVNHCKNRRLYRFRRKHDRHEPLEGTGRDDAPPRQLEGEGPGTDSVMHRSEAERVIHEALDKLDENFRTIIVLRDIECLSYEEISDILDLPRGTVKSRLHRARLELARVVSRTIGPDDVF